MTARTPPLSAVTLLGLAALGACASQSEPIGPSRDMVIAGGAAGQGGGATEPRAGSAGESGAAGGPVKPAGCPVGRGPEMVLIELPDTPSFCIDTTEVTQAQYAAFLADETVDPKAQSREMCRQHNPSFKPPPPPKEGFPECEVGTYDPKTKGELPMSCVDFCDAVAFCEWSGKRVCGSVDGGPLGAGEPENSRKSQWYLACSQGGKTRYPYGDTFVSGKCDAPGKPDLVGAIPASESTCEGLAPPFDRVKDLSGSLLEWEDWTGDGVFYASRGGHSWMSDDPTALACTSRALSGSWQNGARNPSKGIRCCADLPKP